jgi:hypothetical protein
MRIQRFLALGLAVVVCVPALAGAQDTGRVGITMGFPGSVGVLWHATDSVAIRPTMTFTKSSNEGTFSLDTWSLGVDVSALFYMKKHDSVRTYLSPRFSYTRTESSSPPNGFGSLDQTSNSTGGAGTFGAQFDASPRFSVYGEVGFAAAHRTSEATSGVLTSSKGTTWGTVAGVGIVFYP